MIAVELVSSDVILRLRVNHSNEFVRVAEFCLTSVEDE